MIIKSLAFGMLASIALVTSSAAYAHGGGHGHGHGGIVPSHGSPSLKGGIVPVHGSPVLKNVPIVPVHGSPVIKNIVRDHRAGIGARGRPCVPCNAPGGIIGGKPADLPYGGLPQGGGTVRDHRH